MESTIHKWNASDYEKNSSVQFQWAQELIGKLALRGSESLLDIGCGDGKISADLARILTNGMVLGIDSSEAMIRHAATQFPPKEHANLRFRRMDATEISLAERFDVAFSNATLHWVEDQSAVLRGVRGCLKSGGKVLFQMGGRGNAAEIFEAINEILQRPRWQAYFRGFMPPYHFYGPYEYQSWLQEAGFRASRVELIPKDMQHEPQALLGWLRTTWFPYTDRLPVEQRDAFLEEIIKTYRGTHPPDDQGNLHVKMVRLEVEASAD
jgi:trans-aconitate 2-methyltransferase